MDGLTFRKATEADTERIARIINDPPGREALLVAVYCAAAKGDLPGARLALQLARDGGADVGLAAAVIGRLSKTSTRQPSLPKNAGVIDYLFLSLGEKRPAADLAAKAEPELLFFLAHDEGAPAELRVASAERAAALNIIAGQDLARAYREAAHALPKTAQSAPALRARLFAAFESAPSVKIRAESIAALLASARDQGIEVPIAEALAEASAGLVEDREAASFAETGIRVAALAGDEQSAWAWVDAGGEHTPPKAERYIYRFYGPLGKVIGEVQSPRPQPNDSAYSSDGASFLISNANGLSAYNPMDASLRWKIGKPVRFFAAADASSDFVVVSGGQQRQIVELYRSGTKQWDFALPGNVRNLGISSNGEFVLASDAKSLHLFRSAGPKPVWSFTVPNPELSINSVAVNNQGIVVLGAQQSGLKGGMVLILDPAGAQLFQKEMVYSLSNAWIPGVQFDATGKLCLIRTVETLTLVSVQ